MDLDVSNEEVLLIIDDGGLGTVRKPDGKLKRWRGDRSATMVANAIAAFDVNNDGREKKDGQEPLDERVNLTRWVRSHIMTICLTHFTS